MATLLYRIGRFAYRRAWYVVIGWVLVLGAILGGGLALGGQTQESFTIPGTESQQAIDKLDSLFPQAAGAGATMVVSAPDGQNINDDPVSRRSPTSPTASPTSTRSPASSRPTPSTPPTRSPRTARPR